MSYTKISQSSTVRTCALWSAFAVLFGVFFLWDVYYWAQDGKEIHEAFCLRRCSC